MNKAGKNKEGKYGNLTNFEKLLVLVHSLPGMQFWEYNAEI